MAGLELISREGLRLDGRKPHELRKIRCNKGIFTQADVSAYFEQGNTKVIATVYGPHEVTNRSKVIDDRVLINCQYSMATFSTSDRKRRPKGDRKSTDISLTLEKTFEGAIMVESYPRSQIDIYVQVLQSDGGNVPACINAATLALIDAGVPMRDYLCSCTCSFIDDKPIADINFLEESGGSAKLTLSIMPRSGKVVLFQIDSRIHLGKLDQLLQSAKTACQDIFAVLKQAVEKDSLEKSVTLVV